MQGLYNAPKPRHITEYCLNPTISEKVANLAFMFHENDYMYGIKIFQDLMTVIANIDECGLEVSIEEVVAFCQTPGNCDKVTILGGLSGKAFALMEKATSMVSVINQFPGDTDEEAYEQGITFGKALG